MKKWCALVLTLVMAAALFTGCQETDPEKLAAQTVVDVNGETLARGEAEKVYDWLSKQYIFSQAQYGNIQDAADKDFITQMKSLTLGMMAEGLALEQKLRELEGPLTEEDHKGIDQRAQIQHDEIVQAFIDDYSFTDEEALEYLDEIGYTVDAMAYNEYRLLVEDRLRPYAVADVVVTDEAIEDEYARLVSEQESAYAENKTQLITDYMAGNPIVFWPEGFRFFKNLVLAFDEETDAQMAEQDSEYFSKYLEIMTAQNELAGEDVDDERRAELDAQVEALTAQSDTIKNETIPDLRSRGQQALMPQAVEIAEKARADDADFDALLAEYGGDSITESTREGYLVAEDVTTYVQEITTAAMALASVGDISDPVGSDYGLHILQYASDAPSGTISLEEVRGNIEASLRDTLETEAFDAKMVEWIEKATIKTYTNKL